jgi:hypothetical protein
MTTTSPLPLHPSLRIDPRHNGPRRHANGGFACGTFADLVGGTATVALHHPVPLARPFAVRDSSVARVVYDGAQRIATVTSAAPFVVAPPVLPDRWEAATARRAHPFVHNRHALSDCVVCGPRREDGLRVTPGPLVDHPDVLASPYDPRPAFALDGHATPASVWGALDCVSFPAALYRSRTLALLGSLTAHRTREIAIGEQLVAVGWTLGSGTRSHRTASALVAENGDVVASAMAVWVEFRNQRLARIAGRWL